MKYGKLLPALSLVYALPAYTFQFDTQDQIQSALDITLTYGGTWRLDDQDDNLTADPNLDDANRNFGGFGVIHALHGTTLDAAVL